MVNALRRYASALLLAGVLVGLVLAGAAQAQAPDKIKIGYVISLNGPFAPGAGMTTLPVYKLWAHDVNAKGGIFVKQYNKKLPVDVTTYDDSSNPENAIRLTEKLMSEDKMDFVLPPW